jgi:hypothetical protein
VRRQVELAAQLLRSRLPGQVLQELSFQADQLVDRLHHVDRDAYGARLVGDGPGDGLPDPPRRIGGEREPLRVVELLDCSDQSEVALLDEVEKQHAPPDIARGDADDQAQVGLDEMSLGHHPEGLQRLEVTAGRA